MHKIYLAFLLVFVSTQTAFADDALSEMQFTKKYVEAVKSKLPDVEATIISALEVRLKMPSDGELTSFLNNAYSDYRNDPGDLENVLKKYVSSITVSTNIKNESYGKEHIFPVLKDIAYIKHAEELFKQSGRKGLVYEKLNDLLYVVYAFDTPQAVKFLTDQDLKDVGVEIGELKEIAKTNLKNSLPSIQFEGDPSRLALLVADGTYEASFLLFDDLWTKENFPVKGDIVVYVPSRDFVLVTGSDDDMSLKKAQEIVTDPENQWSHIVAEVGFVRKNSKWEVFKP